MKFVEVIPFLRTLFEECPHELPPLRQRISRARQLQLRGVLLASGDGCPTVEAAPGSDVGGLPMATDSAGTRGHPGAVEGI